MTPPAARPVAHARPGQVRITILGPSSNPLSSRVVEDDWYRLGGHRHPDERQQAREQMAGAELREWLRLNQPEPGVYVIWITEIEAGTAAAPDATLAQVRITYH